MEVQKKTFNSGFGEGDFGYNFGYFWQMSLLQVGDGWTIAAVQRGQMACKDRAKALEILVMKKP